MLTIKRAIAVQKIKSLGGEFFSVQFVKKNGDIRDMICRKGVKKHLKGGTLKYNPADYGLQAVFDMQSSYRMVNLNTLRKLKTAGVEYEVVND